MKFNIKEWFTLYFPLKKDEDKKLRKWLQEQITYTDVNLWVKEKEE